MLLPITKILKILSILSKLSPTPLLPYTLTPPLTLPR